jgi:hypothetical protein
VPAASGAPDVTMSGSITTGAYHLDALGLARADQLRHSAFHVAKLAGAFARAAGAEAGEAEIVEHWLPDILLFGTKRRR